MPVSDQELASLVSTHDIISLGMLADDIRRQRHGNQTTFLRVADVAAGEGEPVTVPKHAGEIRIVGTPSSSAQAIARVSEVRRACGDIPLSAFSLADLEVLAPREQTTLRALLENLEAAGLELIAEAPFDLLQNARRSIEEVNIAGLRLARLTIERLPSTDPSIPLRDIVALERAVGVILAFAPLPRRVNPAVPTTGYDDVKRVALARVIVDNIPSIQVDWSLYGPKLAQVALTMGADDVDAVAAIDELALGPRRTALEEVRRNIEAAGFEPVERNGRFTPVNG